VDCTPCSEQLCISRRGHSDVKHVKAKKHKMVVKNGDLKNTVNSYV
jgi:hypothetical protein